MIIHRRTPAHLRPILLFIGALLFSACGSGAQQIIPTERPTTTPTFTPTVTRTPGFDATPTATPRTVASGPTPTSIFGPTQTPQAAAVTATRVINPNAPRIEFFTTNVLQVAPGDQITLFWSVRGARGATIYRLDANGVRGNLWNVPPDGNLTVNTSRRDRGQVSFLLVAGEGDLETTQTLAVPLLCPDPWFFQPAPDACPTGPAEPTLLVEQPMDRGRMIFIQSRARIYALFNDGNNPQWLSFENKYDPAIHPEMDENFEQSKPPGTFQPLRQLGFVWRGNDVVRNRLGLGTNAEIAFDGFVQTVQSGGKDTLYLNSADGTVLELLPEGEAWQIITPPSS
ncbi:MAG: hypothetical protein R3E39_16565 [Anaerolineae bacterium]